MLFLSDNTWLTHPHQPLLCCDAPDGGTPSHLSSWGRPLACRGGEAGGEAAGGGVAVGRPGPVVEVLGVAEGVVPEVADGLGLGDGEGGGDGLAVKVGAGQTLGGVLAAPPVGAASLRPRELQLETTPTREQEVLVGNGLHFHGTSAFVVCKLSLYLSLCSERVFLRGR